MDPVRIVVAAAIALAGAGFLLLSATLVRRRPSVALGPSSVAVVGTATGPGGAPPPVIDIVPPVPDSPAVGVNRRMFMNRAMLAAMSVFGAAFGGGIVAFLWPNRTSGFGSIINAGKLEEILNVIRTERRPFYSAEGRFYIVEYNPKDGDTNFYVKEKVAAGGIMALYQKCAHLGCRVPFCDTSKWFECPCHGSRYNSAGEVQPNSPAAAGLWRFPLDIQGDDVFVDTSKPSAQPAKGVDTLREPPSGPYCV